MADHAKHRGGTLSEVGGTLKPRARGPDAPTGRELWQAGHPTDSRDEFGFDDGPRATPAIAGGRVFTFAAEGRLSCWSLADGAMAWSVDTQKKCGSPKGFFGRACSPVVESNLVTLNVGGRGGAGIVAFDAAIGSLRWQATDDEALC